MVSSKSISAPFENFDLFEGHLRGIELFLEDEYIQAAEIFSNILYQVTPEDSNYEFIFASALWTRMLCYAFQNALNDAVEDLSLLLDLYARKSECLFCIEHTANFSNPNEKLTPEQCRDRVHGTAVAMRALSLKIPDKKLSGLVNICISELENAAIDCCFHEHWTKCLKPIIEAWQYLKDVMDKGVKIAPRALLPSR